MCKLGWALIKHLFNDMKVSEQCGIAAAKGNQILGLIRRIFLKYSVQRKRTNNTAV